MSLSCFLITQNSAYNLGKNSKTLAFTYREKNRDKIYIILKVFKKVFSLLNCPYHLMYGIIILNSRSNCVLCLMRKWQSECFQSYMHPLPCALTSVVTRHIKEGGKNVLELDSCNGIEMSKVCSCCCCWWWCSKCNPGHCWRYVGIGLLSYTPELKQLEKPLYAYRQINLNQ